jgi:diguanylate cyclase (GGDEF)-like protein
MTGTASTRSAAGTWLCPDASDRERLLDMERRLGPVRRATYLILAGVTLASGPWVGWWTIAPLLLAAACFTVLERRMAGSPRPELWAAAAWLANQLAIAGSIALTGALSSPAVGWLVIPAAALPARFPARGVYAGLAASVGLLLASTVGVHPSAALGHPDRILFSVGLLVTVVVMSTALMRSDVEHRNEAVLDPLTGMLNRSALTARVAELAQQARINQLPVGVIVADLDHFKAINDEHGHARGDGVLKDVAYALRKALRAYDLAYRIGGEEFVVLLHGATAGTAAGMAEQLRCAVAAGPVGGERVTMSFGVSASGAGGFDFERVFAEADAALYAAKRGGRNRVEVHGGARPAHAPAPLAA